MQTIQLFLNYYKAFEATYRDDDWSRLEPLFAPDATYVVVGSGIFDCVLSGREAIFAGIRRFLDGFDRHCKRRLEPRGTPEVDGGTIRFAGVGYYQRGDSPEFPLKLQEQITFVDGRITAIEDTYRADFEAKARAWMAEHGAGLELSYL